MSAARPLALAPEDGETVGQRVQRLRRETGQTLTDLGEPGVSREHINAIENGKRQPSWSALLTLAPKLGVSALYLATGQHAMCPICQRPETHAEGGQSTDPLEDLQRAQQIIARATDKIRRRRVGY